MERLEESKYNYIKCQQLYEANNRLYGQKQSFFSDHQVNGKIQKQLVPSFSCSASISLYQRSNSSSNSSPKDTLTVIPKRRTLSVTRLNDYSDNRVESQLRQLINNSKDDLTEDHKVESVRCNSSNVDPSKSGSKCLFRKSMPELTDDGCGSKNCSSSNFKAVQSEKPMEEFLVTKKTDERKLLSLSRVPSLNLSSQQHMNRASDSWKPKCNSKATATSPTSNVGWNSYRLATVSRSKSDIGHRISRPKSKDEIERFFDTIGLDITTWTSLTSYNTESSTSTPHFFESMESIDSAVRNLSVSSHSVDDDTPPDFKENHQDPSTVKNHLPLSVSLSSHGLSRETSIVEKNARVIKWLYNVRKALLDDNFT